MSVPLTVPSISVPASSRVTDMTYLFHEPVSAAVPARADALRPGVALAIAIAGTTLTTILLAAVVAR